MFYLTKNQDVYFVSFSDGVVCCSKYFKQSIDFSAFFMVAISSDMLSVKSLSCSVDKTSLNALNVSTSSFLIAATKYSELAPSMAKSIFGKPLN